MPIIRSVSLNISTISTICSQNCETVLAQEPTQQNMVYGRTSLSDTHPQLSQQDRMKYQNEGNVSK